MGCNASLQHELSLSHEPIPKQPTWLQKYEADLQQELHMLKWREDVSDRFDEQTFAEFKNTIDSNNLLQIAAYFEYDDARIMAIQNKPIKESYPGQPLRTPGYVFDYLALYGSLEAIEISAWYMTQKKHCYRLHPKTLYSSFHRLEERTPRQQYIDRFFRSYPQDRARNPIDIFNIWQHVAWKSRQLLHCRFPNEIVNIILDYGDIHSIAQPKHRHGFSRFFFSKQELVVFFLH